MPDKDFKERVIKMLNKLKSRIQALQKRIRKCNKEPIRNEEYN